MGLSEFQDGILNPHAASCTCAACCDDMTLVSHQEVTGRQARSAAPSAHRHFPPSAPCSRALSCPPPAVHAALGPCVPVSLVPHSLARGCYQFLTQILLFRHYSDASGDARGWPRTVVKAC